MPVDLPDDLNPDPVREPDFRADMRQLFADSRALVDTELAFHKARIGYGARGAKAATIWFVIGLGFIIASTIVLALGGLLILSVIFGPVVATVALTLACLLVAVAALVMARRRLRQTTALFSVSSAPEDAA